MSLYYINWVGYTGRMTGALHPKPGKIRIVLADDHPQVQKQLQVRLRRESDFDVVGVVVNSAQILKEIYEIKPDLLLIDPMMRDGLGLATLRQIYQHLPKTAIVVLTAFVDTALAVQLREIGISLSIATRLPPRADIESGVAINPSGSRAFSELGIRAVEIEAGSGYHIPEGSFVVYLPEHSSAPDQSRGTFPSSNFKRWALNLVRSGQHDPTLLTG